MSSGISLADWIFPSYSAQWKLGEYLVRSGPGGIRTLIPSAMKIAGFVKRPLTCKKA